MKYKCSHCNHIQRSIFRPISCPHCYSSVGLSTDSMPVFFMLLRPDDSSYETDTGTTSTEHDYSAPDISYSYDSSSGLSSD